MAGQNLINTLKTRIEGKEKTAAQLLKKLVAIPSVSGSESEMQAELHLLFSGLKGESSLIPIPESLRADPNFASGISVPFEGRPQTRYLWKGAGGGKSLIACAHVDVVAAGDWADAFAPRIEGDLLIGRGAVDDKASIVSLYLAVETLQEINLRLGGNLEFHFTNEEEVGMAGALSFVRQGFRAEGVLVCEPTDHDIYIANRGALQFIITIEGKQAHLGNKRYGVSAVEKAAKVIYALIDYEDRLIAEGKGYPLFESYEYPGQVNVGIIHGGDFFSIVPDRVTMEGGVGFLPNRTIEHVQGELRALIAGIDDPWIPDHVCIDFKGIRNDPYEMPQGHPFTDALIQTLEGFDRTPRVMGMMATCDARHYYNQGGMPSIVYGGKNSHQAHARHEFAEISDILETAAEYAAFFIDWCARV
jgi:acetylornithine deacetylase